MAIADAPQLLHEHGRRDHVASLTLNRLYKNRGYFFGGQRRLQQFFFDEARKATREHPRFLASAHASAIHVGIAHVGHAWYHWREAALLLRLRSRQRQSPHGASVKRAVERNDVLPLGV